MSAPALSFPASAGPTSAPSSLRRVAAQPVGHFLELAEPAPRAALGLFQGVFGLGAHVRGPP
ncbi:hypothetical protein SAMN02745157_0671 [Kaistia soli DSM 19436]|uniref:Uncharacterized protein n=1 Tax=Kaistia soli DSM 19436 TaxID=1122133 RepID=A0A1M4VCX9_9HYPH|nr:hypothetical protein SAMN02745157_0671 [Kaistia soli DSM 19436]